MTRMVGDPTKKTIQDMLVNDDGTNNNNSNNKQELTTTSSNNHSNNNHKEEEEIHPQDSDVLMGRGREFSRDS